MPVAKQTIEHVETLERYKHGFVTDVAQEFAPKGLSEATNHSSINWLVASSTNTSNVQGAARSSNQRCSEPSIWTSSPICSRRYRGCWIRLRSALETQIPARRIQFRNVSRETRRS